MRQHNIAFQCKTKQLDEHEFRLTFREKLAILFSRTLRLVMVPEEEWDEYVRRILGDG